MYLYETTQLFQVDFVLHYPKQSRNIRLQTQQLLIAKLCLLGPVLEHQLHEREDVQEYAIELEVYDYSTLEDSIQSKAVFLHIFVEL